MEMKTWKQWSNAITDGVRSVPDDTLLRAARLIHDAKMILTAGNGGSHALASHAAQAFMKPGHEAGGGRPSVCLTDAIPTLTAHANDGGWENTLVELARPFVASRHTMDCDNSAVYGGQFNCRKVCGTVAVVVFSSSGKSPNIVKLANYTFGCDLIAFTGFDGGPLRKILQDHPHNGVSLHVNSDDYEIVEPVHDAFLHRIQTHLRSLAEQR